MNSVRGREDLDDRGSNLWKGQEDGELLPKSDILESQLATSLEGGDESANKRRNHAGMVPADRETNQVPCARMNK